MNGGPAFPRLAAWKDDEHDGMSLRDYFAAAALTGLLANDLSESECPDCGQWLTAAKRAYAFADDMLKERAK